MVLMAEKKTITKTDKFAVIETGGKQYLVRPGGKLKVERIKKPEKGNALAFEKVLLVAKGEKVEVGAPYLSGLKVKAEWLAEKRAKKVTNVRYKSKTRQSRKQGHRQIYTEILIADF